MKKILLRIQHFPYLSHIISIIGGVVYFSQAWIYAHTFPSMVDEGGYLYIGYRIINGDFRLFQDNGPIQSAYAPLAYLIPGIIQKVFGPSLRAGRYFSIFLAILMLLGLWLTARRLGGNFWAAAAVWVYALSPSVINLYSLAATQIIVSCMLTWCFWFCLGEGRRTWQLFMGAFLAGAVVMTRISLLPLLPLIILYIFWQNGWKSALWALLGSLIPGIIFHTTFWPDILKLWAPWVPAGLIPLVDAYRMPSENIVYNLARTQYNSMLSFSQGFSANYFFLIGFIAVLILWPRRNEWKNSANRRCAFFLFVLFLVLFIITIWGIYFSNNVYACIFCFAPYLGYFTSSAILLMASIFPSILLEKRKGSVFSWVVMILFILICAMGLGFANFEKFGTWLLSIRFPAVQFSWDPQRWFPGFTIWEFLNNKYQLEYDVVRQFAPVVFAFLLGLFCVGLGLSIFRILTRKEILILRSFRTFLMLFFLGLGIFLSPLMESSIPDQKSCSADILEAYERVGSSLVENIPAEELVYWDVSSATALLYDKEIDIYPAQIYTLYGYRTAGDPESLARFGLWDHSMAEKWINESNVIVLGPENYISGVSFSFDPGQFDVITTPLRDPCDENSYLIILIRKHQIHSPH